MQKVSVNLQDAIKIFSKHIDELMRQGKPPKDAVSLSCKVLGIKLDPQKEYDLIKTLEDKQKQLREAQEKGLKVQNGIVIQEVHNDDYKELSLKEHLQAKKIG